LETFDFGPVGGPFVTATDNGNFISAPLVIAAPAPIPTMGQWGIIILGLLTTIFGVVMVNEQYIRLAKIKS
ncbi:MAG: IPTL-CTERM sorting domain-containing protein, partial [Saprospiraceae bacterium]|nr:IPTL-CTERM sorting domain-containing protein [Saprospiraceae bacterium]